MLGTKIVPRAARRSARMKRVPAMPKRRPRRVSVSSSAASATASASAARPLPPPAIPGARQAHLSGAALFPPGEPLAPVPGLTGPGGSPRQWAYPVGYNIAQRPRATEQTSFEQLRNLAALYDGIQLCERVYFDLLGRDRKSVV